jgi:hypothetical protein
VDTFLDNAREILSVAAAGGSGDPEDFAVIMHPDGGLHLVMGCPVSLAGAAAMSGGGTVYYVTRNASGVRVEGQSGLRRCSMEDRRPDLHFLQDQAFYRITSGGSEGIESAC